MSFIVILACTDTSAKINNMHIKAISVNKGNNEIEFGSFDGGKDAEHNAVVWWRYIKYFQCQTICFFETAVFDRVSLYQITVYTRL